MSTVNFPPPDEVRRGRPKRDHEPVYIKLDIGGFDEALKAMADESGRTVTGYIRHLIEEDLRRHKKSSGPQEMETATST